MAVFLTVIISAGLWTMFLPLLSGPTALAFFGIGDAWKHTGPVQYYMDSSIHSGHCPLWNPLISCGQPIAGNPLYLLFYPPNLLRSLLTPAPTPWRTHVGLAILTYLHALSAAYGAYLLARSFGMSRLAALTASIVFVFSSAFTIRLFNHLHIEFAASYIPWLFYGLNNAMCSRSWRSALAWYVVLGLTSGLALLAGFPQINFVAGFSLVLFYIVARVADLAALTMNRAPGYGAWSSVVARDLSLGLLAIGVAAGLSSALLFPAVELSQWTYRGETNPSHFLPLYARGPRWNVGELLSLYVGSPRVEGFKAAGAAALILSALGLFSLHRRHAIVLGIFGLLMIDACRYHSWFMGDLLHLVAPFPSGPPGRGMTVTVLPIALLAGFGVDRISRTPGDTSERRMAGLLCLAVGLTSLALIYRRIHFEGGSVSSISYEALAFPAATLGLALFGLWSKRARACAVAIVLILALESIYSRHEYLRNTDLPLYRGSAASAKTAGVFWNTNSREVVEEPEVTNTGLYTLSGRINGYDPVSLRGLRELMAPRRTWRGAYFRDASVRDLAIGTNRANLLLKRAFWLQREFVRGPIPGNAISFPPTTTCYVQGAAALGVKEVAIDQVPDRPYSDTVSRFPILGPQHEFAVADGGYYGVPLGLPLPSEAARQHSALSVDLSSDCSVYLEVYVREGAEEGPRRLVGVFPFDSTRGSVETIEVPLPDAPGLFVELAPYFTNHSGHLALERAVVVVDESDEDSHIHVLKRSANEVEVELKNLPSARILTFTDFMYPGWHAYVDDVEVPILKAFTYFKAVEVPAGTHRVRFVFRPVIVYVGITVSVLTGLVSAFLIAWALRRPQGA